MILGAEWNVLLPNWLKSLDSFLEIKELARASYLGIQYKVSMCVIE